MKPLVLRIHIKPLSEDMPRYVALEKAIGVGVGFSGAWYGSQKEHWLGWLGEYSGKGAYGRALNTNRDAEFVYNHIQCAPMLFWLSEALGAPDKQLDSAFEAVLNANPKGASQCAALRAVLTWQDVEHFLANYPYSTIQIVRMKLASFF